MARKKGTKRSRVQLEQLATVAQATPVVASVLQEDQEATAAAPVVASTNEVEAPKFFVHAERAVLNDRWKQLKKRDHITLQRASDEMSTTVGTLSLILRGKYKFQQQVASKLEGVGAWMFKQELQFVAKLQQKMMQHKLSVPQLAQKLVEDHRAAQHAAAFLNSAAAAAALPEENKLASLVQAWISISPTLPLEWRHVLDVPLSEWLLGSRAKPRGRGRGKGRSATAKTRVRATRVAFSAVKPAPLDVTFDLYLKRQGLRMAAAASCSFAVDSVVPAVERHATPATVLSAMVGPRFERMSCLEGKVSVHVDALGSAGGVANSSLLNVGSAVTAIDWCPVGNATHSPASVLQYLAVATSRDGCTLLGPQTREQTGTLQLWSMTEKQLPRLEAVVLTKKIWDLAWFRAASVWEPAESGPNARLGLVATAESDGAVRVYALPHPTAPFPAVLSIAPLKEFSLARHNVWRLAWSPKAQAAQLLLGSFEGGVGVVDLEAKENQPTEESDGCTVRPLFLVEREGKGVATTTVAFSPSDPHRVCAGFLHGVVELWDTQRPWEPLAQLHFGATPVHHVSLLPFDSVVFVVSEAGANLYAWNRAGSSWLRLASANGLNDFAALPRCGAFTAYSDSEGEMVLLGMGCGNGATIVMTTPAAFLWTEDRRRKMNHHQPLLCMTTVPKREAATDNVTLWTDVHARKLPTLPKPLQGVEAVREDLSAVHFLRWNPLLTAPWKAMLAVAGSSPIVRVVNTHML